MQNLIEVKVLDGERMRILYRDIIGNEREGRGVQSKSKAGAGEREAR